MCAAGSQDGPAKPEDRYDLRAIFIASAIAVAFFFLLDVLSWFTERGGVFSVVSAVASILARRRVIDVDENALWLPFTAIFFLAGFGSCRVLGLARSPLTRLKSVLLVLGIMAAAFAFDEACGEAIITNYMAGHGYQRCEAGDWAQGNGKSRVWFADYVLKGVDCRQRIATVPERTVFR
jgi:hypothetical protein